MPIAHNEGNYFADGPPIARLEDEGRVAFRYCERRRRVNDAANPNGSLDNIAGILNEHGNVLGMMPHPERARRRRGSAAPTAARCSRDCWRRSRERGAGVAAQAAVVLIPLKDATPSLDRLPLRHRCADRRVRSYAFLWQLSLGATGNRIIYALGAIPAVLTGDRALPPDLALVPAPLTLVTSMFLHGSWLHLGGNMLFLWIFGDNVEDAMGHVRFLVFYLLCGVLARWRTCRPTCIRSNPDRGCIGRHLRRARGVPHPASARRGADPVLALLRHLPAFVVLGVWIGLQALNAYMETGGEAGGGVAWWAHRRLRRRRRSRRPVPPQECAAARGARGVPPLPPRDGSDQPPARRLGTGDATAAGVVTRRFEDASIARMPTPSASGRPSGRRLAEGYSVLLRLGDITHLISGTDSARRARRKAD